MTVTELSTEARRQLAVETDTALADLHMQAGRAASRIASAKDDIHRAAGDKRRDRYSGPWLMKLSEALAAVSALKEERTWAGGFWFTPSELLAELSAAEDAMHEIQVQIGNLDAVHRVHGWNRYFLVTNGNGHVHRNMSCHTCFPTTQYAWLVELADCDEAEMVSEFGEKACTVCFPDAPANPQYHAPGRRDREAIEARQAEKAARADAKALKNLAEDDAAAAIVITAGRGEQFRDTWGWVTTVAGAKKVLRDEVEYRDYFGHGKHPSHAKTAEAAEHAKAVLLAREAARPGSGATQDEIDKIIASAVKKNRKDGARI